MASSKYCLAELPEVVMKRILEKSDIRSIFTLRKVSPTFRDFIDSTIPDTNLKIIGITIKPNFIWVRYTNSDKKILRICYGKHENGCSIEWGNGKKKLVENDYLWVFCADIINVLKHQKTLLRYFTLRWTAGFSGENWGELAETEKNILKNIEENYLKLRSRPLKIQNIRLDAVNKKQVMRILPYLDSNTLQTIGISNPNTSSERIIELGEIVELEQWKRAGSLYTPGLYLSERVQDLSHFQKADVSMRSVTVDDVVHLKETFLNSSSSINFHINFFRFPDNDQLSRVFGIPSRDGGDGHKQYLINYSNPKKLLNIVVSPKSIHFESVMPS